MDATPNQEPESVREEPKRRRRGTFVRYLVASLALVLLLGLLAGVKVSQIATLISFAQDAEEQGPPPEAVSAATVSRESWEDTLAAVGTVAADEDLAISSEVPGIVARIEFESGAVVERGDVLVVLDSGTEHADLRSAQAAHALANSNAGRTAELASRGVQSLDVLERAEAERVSADARVMGLRAMLSKKTIRAPFGGRVGIREVHVGQYVAPGTVLTTLGSLDQLFVDFTVPQEHLADVSVETPIRVRLGRESEPIAGAISAMGPKRFGPACSSAWRWCSPNAERSSCPRPPSCTSPTATRCSSSMTSRTARRVRGAPRTGNRSGRSDNHSFERAGCEATSSR
jgi:membrane fusion protein (multidrug efflux system)